MNKWFTAILVVMLSFGVAVNDAAAKRFGGRFMGMGRSKTSFSSLFTKKSTQDLKSKAIVNKQRGFLRGLLIGGLLASLFMGHGLPIALLSWMMIAGLILFMMNLYRKRQMNRL
ncbi:hypothetical protein [Legionella erythra]|uniref:Transmembrane protein n=1 Tax=Legionella erythra TaxID=448 RepID=A0A0W0TFZ5_LEGER|nr:hypothetical protein [Legionella erythra]KTC94491.1 transmembrane protein [Legionella erythra]